MLRREWDLKAQGSKVGYLTGPASRRGGNFEETNTLV